MLKDIPRRKAANVKTSATPRKFGLRVEAAELSLICPSCVVFPNLGSEKSKPSVCESDNQFAEMMIVSVPEALGGAITAYVLMPF